jgi:small neutral amino acid transporter SnatA (MarC family)
VAVTANALFVAHCFGKGLTQRDADIFHRVMGVDMQVAMGFNVQIDQAVTAIWSSMWSRKGIPVCSFC